MSSLEPSSIAVQPCFVRPGQKPRRQVSRDDIEAQIWFISVCRPDNKVGDQFTAAYTLHGASVGHTSLRAVTYLPDSRTVASHAKPVEVSVCL